YERKPRGTAIARSVTLFDARTLLSKPDIGPTICVRPCARTMPRSVVDLCVPCIITNPLSATHSR
ncbi:MAG: hypothetical protein K8T91_19330, partial [Planctomycetes bacterium]|nr:hypothetical protein [Planctomycetota bacterium]